jgi:cytochrome c556
MQIARLARRAVPFLVLAITFGIAPAQAQQPTKAEQTLKYRKAVYQVMAWNFGPMAAMAQGKIPYDAQEFELRAQRVAELTPMLAESYTPDTQSLAGSKAKPELWSHREDFDAKLKTLVDRSATLATVARTGDAEKSKAAFLDTAQACKACHDKYRADD